MKKTPAKPLTRYAVVNELGEPQTTLYRRREMLDRLVEEHGDPGERVAEFECKEKKK